jgi:hypothetical protein
MMKKGEWITGTAYVAVLAALPLVGYWARIDAQPSCAFDGSHIDPLYQVRVVDADGRDREFCCVGCAEHWLQQETRTPQAIVVTDEISGETLDAAAAVFVRSLVVTQRTTGNRIHAFRSARDAEHHARYAHGQVLDGSERPFVPR